MLIKVIKNNGKFELQDFHSDVMPGMSEKLWKFKNDVLPKMNETNNYYVSNNLVQFMNILSVDGQDIYFYELY